MRFARAEIDSTNFNFNAIEIQFKCRASESLDAPVLALEEQDVYSLPMDQA
jgi:hypothetical protein